MPRATAVPPAAAVPPVTPPAFADFAQSVYPFLELQPFHRVYYRVLEAFAQGRIRRLIVTMPPQHGKSVGATTLLPAYLLGLDPDCRVAIASYSGALASKFNRRVQRILDSREYGAFFPATTIKQGTRPPSYIRTADEVEIIGRRGSLLSVGREGSLTGNRVDCFILDDLYKDAMEANSPLVRANCWEWYTSVVRTRMHNRSRELIVFTRWHEEDLIGSIAAREPVEMLHSWAQLDAPPQAGWLHLNFEALKASPPTELDPRAEGEALWEQQQGAALLAAKRRLDPLQFEAMYQGHPTAREGLLYGLHLAEYDALPREIVRRASYTDTADTGDDYLCSLAYVVDVDGLVYITDAVYTRDPMEVTERLVAEMFLRSDTRQAAVESNNGGRGFARAVQALAPDVRVEWFHQSGNKEARILSNAATVLHLVRFPRGWALRWPELYGHLTTYRRTFRANRWHDAADVVTGIVEREVADRGRRRVWGVRFL
ncbi:phage terminase large subunit [uncultured Alistipes sp.]|uniref:phage terminase large subunit n=1 Tax=uncultured Alistipes sp. TaxID=538949 RepID=UPI002804840E|nr:phage terminase large subunit [uncultured Alistipes sp.]